MIDKNNTNSTQISSQIEIKESNVAVENSDVCIIANNTKSILTVFAFALFYQCFVFNVLVTGLTVEPSPVKATNFIVLIFKHKHEDAKGTTVIWCQLHEQLNNFDNTIIS